MRKTIVMALMAAVAMAPAIASAQDRGRWGGRGEGGQRSQSSQPARSAPQRDYNGGNTSRPAPQAQPQRARNGGDAARWAGRNGGNYQPRNQTPTPQVRPLGQAPAVTAPPARPAANGNRGWRGRPDGGGNPAVRTGGPDRNGAVNAGNRWRQNRPDDRPRGVSPQAGRDGRDARDWRGNDNRRGDDRWRGNQRPGGNDWRGNGNNRGNYAWRGGSSGRNGWDHDWRGSNRYDWQRYRTSNRNLYHLPRYYAPYGWNYGYRRFGVGMVLDSLLFSQSYWIDDPYDYRLPDAYGEYRWVRYYNDALLVDVYTGEVVDVVHDIFW